MDILVNATTLVGGGGAQVGRSFIEQAIHDKCFTWRFLVSKEIFNNLDISIQVDNRIVCITDTPAKIIAGIKSRKIIKKNVDEFKPDLIYSIGFPSYIRFKQIELARFTNPWSIYKDCLPWTIFPSLFTRSYLKLGIFYRNFWARKADYFETQTEDAKLGIFKNLSFPIEKIKVIPNSVNPMFLNTDSFIKDDVTRYTNDHIVFCLSAPYSHKNLDLIPEVASILKYDYNMEMKFYLTIPYENKLWIDIVTKSQELNVSNLVFNVGKIKLHECIAYYKKSKVVFLPTLLEIFSATYLEAMAMQVPIVTTDLSFAHDNCKDAALYFKPGDADDAAKQINKLVTQKKLFQTQVLKGAEILASYPKAEEKFLDLKNYISTIIKTQ